MNIADIIAICALTLLFLTWTAVAIKAIRCSYKEEPMTKSKEALTKRELEQQLERTQRELQQAKNDAISKENLAKAELEKVQKEVEAAEWAKAQPKYFVQVTKLDGTKIKTQEFVATASATIRDVEFGRSPYEGGYVLNPSRYIVDISKEDAKSLAQKFIDNSKNDKAVRRQFGFEFVEHNNTTVIGDLTILNHAIESFEIIEVKAKK